VNDILACLYDGGNAVFVFHLEKSQTSFLRRHHNAAEILGVTIVAVEEER
jgi:hypothetical protein